MLLKKQKIKFLINKNKWKSNKNQLNAQKF